MCMNLPALTARVDVKLPATARVDVNLPATAIGLM